MVPTIEQDQIRAFILWFRKKNIVLSPNSEPCLCQVIVACCPSSDLLEFRV